jgi:hypothetical protein
MHENVGAKFFDESWFTRSCPPICIKQHIHHVTLAQVITIGNYAFVLM